MGFASGKHAKFISDRSGMAFPYKERVREWNGSIVHISEFEAKHPQLEPSIDLSDDIALKDARPDTNNIFTVKITFPTFNTVTLRHLPLDFLIGSVGQVVVTGSAPGSPTTVSLTGISATSAVGSLSASTISSTFDSTSVTLDSSNKTFDEG